MTDTAAVARRNGMKIHRRTSIVPPPPVKPIDPAALLYMPFHTRLRAAKVRDDWDWHAASSLSGTTTARSAPSPSIRSTATSSKRCHGGHSASVPHSDKACFEALLTAQRTVTDHVLREMTDLKQAVAELRELLMPR